MPSTCLESGGCARNSNCAGRSRTLPITPRKSAPCTPNSDCAMSQGSWFNGEPTCKRFRHSIALLTILYPPRIKVVGMIRPPDLLLLPSAGLLTIGVSASTLTSPDSGIRTEPTAANRTRSLSGLRHGDSSSPCQKQGFSSVFLPVGHSR